MDVVDSSLGSTYSIALTNANVNLTQTNCQNARIKLTGLLSANVTIYFPSGVGGFFIVQNATTGAYTVTLASAGGGTYVTASGGGGITQSTFIFSDGTNITFADDVRLQLNAGTGISITSGTNPTISNTGVLSFNTRTGTVSLTSGDVTGALGYTPPTPTGSGASGTWGINVTGTSYNITQYTINQSVGTGNTPSFTGLNVTNGDLYVYRTGGTTGVLYLGNSGARYLYYDGSNYQMSGAELYVNGALALNTGNYNSYAPTLTGTGAFGTWGINVSGNAATVTNGVYNNGGTYGINISGNAATVTNGVYNNSGTYSINITGSSGYASTAGTASTVSGGYVSAVYAGSGISVNANQGAITISSTLAGGTVTSVATNNGLTGGTITTTGTLGINTNNSGGVGAYAVYFAPNSGAFTQNGTYSAASMGQSAGTWRCMSIQAQITGITCGTVTMSVALFIRTV